GTVAFLRLRFRFVSNFVERWADWQAERARMRALQKAEQKKAKTLRRQTIVTDKPPDVASRSKADTASTSVEREEPRRETVVATVAETTRSFILPRRKATAAASVSASAEFPSTALLHAPSAAISVNEDELRQRARQIEEKTREFEVVGT